MHLNFVHFFVYFGRNCLPYLQASFIPPSEISKNCYIFSLNPEHLSRNSELLQVRNTNLNQN